MRIINNTSDLKLAIRQLELKEANELNMLKGQFKATTESLKPLNIIKNTFKKAAASPDLKSDVFNAAIGLTTGVLAKKLMIGKTANPFKKLMGIGLEMLVANKIAKNADSIKSAGNMVIKKIFSKKDDGVTS